MMGMTRNVIMEDRHITLGMTYDGYDLGCHYGGQTYYTWGDK